MHSNATHQNNKGDFFPVITEVAAVTALGDDLDCLWRGVLNGTSAIRPVRRFPVKNYSATVAACIEDLERSAGASMIHPLLDRLFSKMAPVPADARLITATTKAGIDNLERFQRGKPAGIQDFLPASLPLTVSQKRHIDDRGINISAACASSTIAVAHGAALIASGRAEVVLVCCLDLVTEFIFSGFSALKALSPGPCKPFDRNRQGLSLGEGAAALLLMSPERARQENRVPLGTICGWGSANDATHITAPARDGSGLIRAVSQALCLSGMACDDIAAISAHGTGTVYNDLMELTAFRHLFGKRNVPAYSIKGAIGHTLGAAGGIELALGLKALAERIVPPTVGIVDPMAGAQGIIGPEPVSFSGNTLLTTNSGFGGVNAAIVLKGQAE